MSEQQDSPVAILQKRVTELDGDNLPSDIVGNPVDPRSGMYAWIVAAILWIGMVAVDWFAWLWYTWDFLATICGKPPPRCNKRCRYCIDKTVLRCLYATVLFAG